MAKSPQYDFQREEVYRWEQKFQSLQTSPLPVKAFRRMARKICQHYGLRTPFIGSLRHKNYAALTYESGDVYFCSAYRGGWLLCHEFAHYVLNEYGYRREFHGQRWLGLFIYLLDVCELVPLCASVPSARAAGLKFRRPATCAPGRLRSFLGQPIGR